MKRRTFLQQAGWVLAALGVSETGLLTLGGKSFALPMLDRYYQALAQPTARKLALLVGINQYPRSAALSGCVTDVELQRELLIHRFSFSDRNILTLTEQQATRENIETAFKEHLIEQAGDGDVVLFHFSGYGSRINITRAADSESPLQNPPSNPPYQNGLLPVDGVLPTKQAANYLLEDTLKLLLRSLQTDLVTTVLDTSYTDADTGLQGNLRIRSHPSLDSSLPTPEELAFQEELLLALNTSRQKSDWGEMPGIVLSASAPTQAATEAAFGGFSAGLFTYALTQHLWQTTPPITIQVTVTRAAEAVEQLVGKQQNPTLSGQKSLEELQVYNLTPASSIGADGVVVAVEDNGKTAQLWLAGLPARVLAYYGVNSVLSVVNSQSLLIEHESSVIGNSEEVAPIAHHRSPMTNLVQIRARSGLAATAFQIGTDALSTSSLQVGQLVQESIRVLPRNVGLTVALDSRLERIERVDATSAFANVRCVSSVAVAGEHPADYLFGKATQSKDLTESAGGYGLFSLGGELIPNTMGEATEAVKSAVNRLSTKLQTLLAAKLWRLSANEQSSRLGIAATLEIISPTQQVLMQRETPRAPISSRALDTDESRHYEVGIPTLPIGSGIQYRVENYSDRPVYLMLLGLDSSQSAIAHLPLVSSPDSSLVNDTVISPGQTLTLPQLSSSFKWIVQGPLGLVETYLICSRAPFTQAIAAMATSRRPQGERERIGGLFNPLEVARSLLQDLHQASTNPESAESFTPETQTGSPSYQLDVNAWATLSFIYQLTPAPL